MPLIHTVRRLDRVQVVTVGALDSRNVHIRLGDDVNVLGMETYQAIDAHVDVDSEGAVVGVSLMWRQS